LSSRRVPVEYGPFETGKIFIDAATREVDEQGFADAATPHVGAHIKIFEI